jgi:hypothetical protein
MQDRVKVTVIATGLGCDASTQVMASLHGKSAAATASAAGATANAAPAAPAANANAPVNPAGASASAEAEATPAVTSDLQRAREIAKRLGMINTEGQDFDVPAFMRRSNDNSNNA